MTEDQANQPAIQELMVLDLEPRKPIPASIQVDEVYWVPTVAELDSIIQNHRNWVESDGTNGRKENLSNVALPDTDFAGSNLRGILLSGAYLQEVNFSEAYLSGAELDDADLRGADLSGVDLRNADLSGAELQDVDLTGADLRNIDFTEVELLGCSLSNTDFSHTSLSGFDLRGADLRGAALGNVDLSGADLRDADLSGADLPNADLSGADLRDADLSGADLPNADLSDADLQDADFSETHAVESDLSGSHLDNADFSESNLAEANLADVSSTGSDLSGAILSSAKLRRAYFPAADLSDAKIKNADLTGATLLSAELSGAKINGSDLSEVDLQGANLTETFLSDTDLSGSALNGANLTEVNGLQASQLRGADVSLTSLPDAINGFEGLSTVKATTQSAKKLFISVLVACAYATLAVTLRKEEVIAEAAAGGAEGIPLPIIGLSMETGPFYLVTPVLLALLFGYFHLQMQRLWSQLAQLPAVFPDGKPLDEKVHPWLITGLSRAHVGRLKERSSPPFFLLQYFVASLLAWWTVPLTLGYFAWMYSLSTSVWSSLFLHMLTAVTVSAAIVGHRKAIHTLELREHRRVRFWRPDSSEKEVWVLKSTGFWIGVTFLVFATVVWYVRFYGGYPLW